MVQGTFTRTTASLSIRVATIAHSLRMQTSILTGITFYR
jgi:hypothetical protein